VAILSSQSLSPEQRAEQQGNAVALLSKGDVAARGGVDDIRNALLRVIKD